MAHLKPTAFCAVLALCTAQASGQELRKVPPRYPHLLFLPKKAWSSGKKWPLILYLHGSSHRGNDLGMLTRYGLPKRLQTDKGFPFIVVAPQLPPGKRWTDTRAMAALVQEASRLYPVDRTRVYAIGFSMGASGTWRVAHDYPNLFAGIVSIAGVYEKPLATSGKLKSVPIWSIHGSVDKDASPAEARQALSLHMKSGGTGRFELLPGKGHSIPQVFDRSDIYQWLVRHRKG